MSPRLKLSAAQCCYQASLKPKVILGFDRLTLWQDHSEFPGSLELIKNNCTDIQLYLEQMPYQSRWKLRIEVFQPTKKCLRLLAEALGNNVTAMLTNVEIACDFPAESDEQALLWRDTFLAAARMKYQGQSVELDDNDNTWYYGRCVNEDGNKRGKVLAVYADKPSKILNAQPEEDDPTCLHVELRATGSDVLSGLGIVTLLDLIEFRHKRFWNEHIHLFELPKPTQLGRLLAKTNGADLDVSTTAFRRRAARWIKSGSTSDKFVMHNALLTRSDIANQLVRVPFKEWIKMYFR